MSALRFSLGTTDDATEVAVLHERVADALTARHGAGHWSSPTREPGVLRDVRDALLLVGRDPGDTIVATGVLARTKPWAIDVSFFSSASAPLYVHRMAVAPEQQRIGIGRALVDELCRVARARGADVLRLDAYDAAAGAGPFYAKCGFRETGGVVYRTVPLVYFELRL